MATSNPKLEQIVEVAKALSSTRTNPYPGVEYRGRNPGVPTNQSVGRATGTTSTFVRGVRKNVLPVL